jgi:hypothetical protein
MLCLFYLIYFIFKTAGLYRNPLSIEENLTDSRPHLSCSNDGWTLTDFPHSCSLKDSSKKSLILLDSTMTTRLGIHLEHRPAGRARLNFSSLLIGGVDKLALPPRRRFGMIPTRRSS